MKLNSSLAQHGDIFQNKRYTFSNGIATYALFKCKTLLTCKSVPLSNSFDVSLDTLIKGDLEEMKEKIKTEDIAGFKRDGAVFAVLLISVILLAAPLVLIPLIKRSGSYICIGIWVLLYAVTMYYAIRIEKQKKKFDIQTYKEIVAFDHNKELNQIEKTASMENAPTRNFCIS